MIYSNLAKSFEDKKGYGVYLLIPNSVIRDTALKIAEKHNRSITAHITVAYSVRDADLIKETSSKLKAINLIQNVSSISIEEIDCRGNIVKTDGSNISYDLSLNSYSYIAGHKNFIEHLLSCLPRVISRIPYGVTVIRVQEIY